MKKIIAFTLSLIAAFTFAACAKNDNTPSLNDNTPSLNVYAPDGAPALAIAKLIHDDNQFGSKVNYNIVSAQEIGAKVADKSADIAILPINLASKLAQNDYKLATVNTHGNLYLLGAREIESLSELKGETIAVFGQGTVPDLTFKIMLEKNDIEYTLQAGATDKVILNYYPEMSDAAGVFVKKTVDFALIAQPAAQNALSKRANSLIVADLQEELGEYPQAVLVVKKSLLENNAALVKSFILAMRANASWLVENNIENAVDAIKGVFGATSLNAAAITIDGLIGSNIKVVLAKDMKEKINTYIDDLKNIVENSANVLQDSFFADIEIE